MNSDFIALEDYEDACPVCGALLDEDVENECPACGAFIVDGLDLLPDDLPDEDWEYGDMDLFRDADTRIYS